MMTILGQEKLINNLESYNLDNFPHSVVLQGEKGSGKHLISKYIAENVLKIPLVDITDKISPEMISNIYRNPSPVLYLINVDNLVEKEQNSLLKFIEEPLNTIFIILLCENSNSLLLTVYNRCVLLEMKSYTKDVLEQFIPNGCEDKDLILDLVRTPGKLKELNLSNLKDLIDLCDKIADKIEFATYTNTLSISNKINYKDNYDRFDLELFFDALSIKLRDKYFSNNKKKYFDMYLLTADYRKRLIDKRLNKEIFMQNYLTNLWKMCKSNSGF